MAKMFAIVLKETKTIESVYTTTSTEFVSGVFATRAEAEAASEAFMLKYEHPHKFFHDEYDGDIIALYVLEITLGADSVPTLTYVPVPKAIEDAHIASGARAEAENE